MTGRPPTLSKHIDDNVFYEMKTLLGEDFAPLLNEYLHNSAHYFQQLSQAIADKQIHTALDIAHTLKGASLNLGLHRLTVLCQQIENALHQQHSQKLDKLLTLIKDEIDGSNTEIYHRLNT